MEQHKGALCKLLTQKEKTNKQKTPICILILWVVTAFEDDFKNEFLKLYYFIVMDDYTMESEL